MTALNGILDKLFFNENTLKYKHMCFTRRSRTTKHKMTRPFDLLGMFELQIYKYSLLSLKKAKTNVMGGKNRPYNNKHKCFYTTPL